MQVPAGKKGNENALVCFIPQLFNKNQDNPVQAKPAQVGPIEPKPYLKRGTGSSGSGSLKRINRMNEEFGKNEGQGLIKQVSKSRQSSPLRLPSIPMHNIPSESDTNKKKATLKKVPIRTINKTVKSQVIPRESQPVSDPNQMIQETPQKKFWRLFENLKKSMSTKDIKDIQTQLQDIYDLFNNLFSDLQKKIEFHKPGPQRSQRYSAKRRQLQKKLEQAKEKLEEYQTRCKESDFLWKEALRKNDLKAETWEKIRQQELQSINQYTERVNSLIQQIKQFEKEISQVKRRGFQPLLFDRHDLTRAQGELSEIQLQINRIKREKKKSQLADIRQKWNELQDRKTLICEKIKKAQKKEEHMEEIEKLQAEYIDTEKKIARKEQEIRITEQVLKYCQ